MGTIGDLIYPYALHILQSVSIQSSFILIGQYANAPSVTTYKSVFLTTEIVDTKVIETTETRLEEANIEKDVYTSSIKRSFLHVLISKLYREKTKDKNVYLQSN